MAVNITLEFTDEEADHLCHSNFTKEQPGRFHIMFKSPHTFH
jgi:hypothetical protein